MSADDGGPGKAPPKSPCPLCGEDVRLLAQHLGAGEGSGCPETPMSGGETPF